MTKEQLTAIFSELNGTGTIRYTFGDVLEMEEISSIVLESDESIFPDKTLHIKFGEDDNLFYLHKGSYINGVFETKTVINAIDIGKNIGFVLVNPYNNKSPYKFGSAA